MSEEKFTIKDSGNRQQFASGMVRDTNEGKIHFWRVLAGPMFKRWAEHLTKGAVKYPDVRPGVSNWTLADDEAAFFRFKDSALRHFLQWFDGDRDEDHGAAVFFNINGAENTKEKLDARARELNRIKQAADIDLEFQLRRSLDLVRAKNNQAVSEREEGKADFSAYLRPGDRDAEQAAARIQAFQKDHENSPSRS